MSSSTEEPPFNQIAIVGLGLIGGSIALAARERWPSVRITGVDRQAVLAHALGSGAIDRGVETVESIGGSDLVILAAPVRQNVQLLRAVASRIPSTSIVTDVGGTKRDIVSEARALPLEATFIGGHPIGGAERGGFGFARSDLFQGRPWILTPDGGTPPHALERLSSFSRALGARPSLMDPDEHDRVMAFLSHLPQLTASALMEVIGRAAAADGLRLAGRGLVDTTRLASSPASVWKDICATNADAIGAALDTLIARLAELRADLRDGGTIESMFDDAGRWRAELMKGRE
jgi:prephenate dehydrogenase